MPGGNFTAGAEQHENRKLNVTKAQYRASRMATGDWFYRGFIISQHYKTKRWLILKDDCLHGTPVCWVQTLRSAKFRIDDMCNAQQATSAG